MPRNDVDRYSSLSRAGDEDQVDLLDLFLILWGGKWFISGFGAVAGVLSVFFALSLPNIYRAEVLLAPTSGGDSGGLSAVASQYAGIASLAGINISNVGAGVDPTALGIEVLQSRKFIVDFIERHDILVPLMGAKDWDLSDNTLIYDQDVYDLNTNEWVRRASRPRESKPSLLEAYQEFSEIMVVSQSADTSLVKISIDHYSPYIAKHWVDKLVEDINLVIKNQDVSEARNSIEYLNEQLESTALSEMRSIFYQLVEEQTKTIMLANARPEYLFRTVDPAVVTEEKVKPRRFLICLAGTGIGVFFGLVFVLGRLFFLGYSRLEEC